MNPYENLPDHQFWTRAVTWCPPGHLDPVASVPFTISSADKVATMGSCFAQHIARHLQQSGLDYFVTESAPIAASDQEARRLNFGVFSARFGNIYTVRQALQLFDRAFGTFSPADAEWQRDGRLVDPYRPTVEPDGFAGQVSLEEDRRTHLAAVKRMFVEADVIVFTLGLTEGWRNRADGSVYPLAPGVAGGAFDPAQHEPVNFGVTETIEDLFAIIRRTAEVNRNARWVLTVSPVPLKATHSDQHVWTATSYSKSVLRVAAEEAQRAFDNVSYFPSFEIITSPHAQGRYYDDDLRSVTDIGVSHVMRVFSKHFLCDEGRTAHPVLGAAPSEENGDVICDEEEIERSIARFAS